MTSNFMTTSALADMIEKEFHSPLVFLFPNLFFSIPEKQPAFIKSSVESGGYRCRIHNRDQPWQCWRVNARISQVRWCGQDGWRGIPRQKIALPLCPYQLCQVSKWSTQDTLYNVQWPFLKKNMMVKIQEGLISLYIHVYKHHYLARNNTSARQQMNG